jgi:GT2 family glycosyltransferase
MGKFVPKPGLLSIGVAAHGNVETTAECLECLLDSVGGDFELLLIDDQSPDDMLSLYHEVAGLHPHTRIYHFPENLEYTQSVNCLLNEAGGERVLFVSNDILISPEYVVGLLEAMIDPHVGIARGVSNFVDNGLSTHNIALESAIENRGQMYDLARKIYGEGSPLLLDDPFLVGDAFMVSRALLDVVGGFDIRYHGYFSDIDYGLRAIGAGFRRVLSRRSFAWHGKRANFDYLDANVADQKLAHRRQRVQSAWQVFRETWELDELPVNWPGMDALPLVELDQRARNQGIRPAQHLAYDRYLVDAGLMDSPAHGSQPWNPMEQA